MKSRFWIGVRVTLITVVFAYGLFFDQIVGRFLHHSSAAAGKSLPIPLVIVFTQLMVPAMIVIASRYFYRRIRRPSWTRNPFRWFFGFDREAVDLGAVRLFAWTFLAFGAGNLVSGLRTSRPENDEMAVIALLFGAGIYWSTILVMHLWKDRLIDG